MVRAHDFPVLGAGDTVLLRAASLGQAPYIARLQAVRAPAQGLPQASMRWFYRAPDVQARGCRLDSTFTRIINKPIAALALTVNGSAA